MYIGISLPRLPSSTYSLLPTSAVSWSVMSLSTISVTMSCGNLQKSLSFSRCSRPCTHAISFSRCSWKTTRLKPLQWSLMVNLGTNLRNCLVVCLVLVKCKGRLNTGAFSDWPAVVRAGTVVSALILFTIKFLTLLFSSIDFCSFYSSCYTKEKPQSVCIISRQSIFSLVRQEAAVVPEFYRWQWEFAFLCVVLGLNQILVPIYDVSKTPFLFNRDDFITMQSLPRYRKYGARTPSDLPHQSLVTVFFTLNTYPKDYNSSAPSQYSTGGESSLLATPIPTNQNSVLSFNLHSVMYYGVVPEE